MESHLVPDKFEDGSNVLSLEISLSSKSFIDEDSSCVFLIPADKKSCDSITKLTVSPTKSIESISFVSFQGDLDSITQIKASDLGSLFSVITCSGKSKELMFLGIDGIVVGARATKGTDRPTGSILGMHWLLGSSFADFIVVASNGIEYYKVRNQGKGLGFIDFLGVWCCQRLYEATQGLQVQHISVLLQCNPLDDRFLMFSARKELLFDD